MIEKEYYRLDDVVKRFDINLPTIKTLVDQRKITPVFYLESFPLIVGGIDKDRRFVGFGTAIYTGLVSIQRRQFSELWHNSKVKADFLILYNIKDATDYSSSYTFDVKLPSGLIQSWQSTALSELTRSKVIAVCMPKYEYSGFNFSKRMFGDDYIREDYAKLPVFEIGSLPSNVKDYVLSDEKLKLTFNDTYILHADLARNGIIAQKMSSSVKSIPAAKTNDKHKPLPIFKNQFHELLARILNSAPNMPAKTVHKILCQEVATEEDSRTYDSDNILLSNVEGKITWLDINSKKKQKVCDVSTLGNHLTRTKEAMLLSRMTSS